MLTSRPIGGRRPALTPEQQAELRAWAAVGRSTKAVARRYGVHPNTLRSYLRQGLKFPIRMGEHE